MTTQSRFEAKKQKILAQLCIPVEEYHDLSPKGSVDEPIQPLIGNINSLDGLVTTSSCSGRISVFLEGSKRGHETHDDPSDSELSRAGPGGKGGGSWLFISHHPVELSEGSRDEHFILHVLTASMEYAQRVLVAALSAGFRESGAIGLNGSKTGELNPMVAVRSTGYSFDAIIGYQTGGGNNIALVDENHLRVLVGIANERFNINADRIARFQSALLEQHPVASVAAPGVDSNGSNWEEAGARWQRKRKEGLARQHALAAQSTSKSVERSRHLVDGTGAGLEAVFD
ncbi:hypothetical protein EJ04DRAFT_541825 [Polyplosphaeria fusca]|uniref:tRNA(Phe) 7-[(3-amino-3-carboxypropyl)-4-demethylwyosine(37)-N(4)]-methyltransferase n=1 Tax=Polyplosphaeria fusca TaxID=682080 RepID=A0A9P4R1N4_9PLEO|nr:hypothetical protein EJ04DRAFT_541825 [Polyplosphaeria fusca]